MKIKSIFLLLGIVVSFSIQANNIVVSNVALTGQVNGSHTFVRFDLSWDNSFRLSTGPNNWDAAWVFVKFQVTGGTGCTASTVWNHATINTTGHSGPASIDGVSDTRGVFIYRSTPGSGTNTFTNFQIRWNYPTDGVLDACSVTVKVFAIEMVHVPTGGFYLGDGVIGGNARLEASPYGAGNIFQVTSATTPGTLGGGAVGTLGNNNATGQTGGADDFNNVTSQSLPAAFPNGFNRYYIMKYEIGQEQYMEFLNTLTGTQQALRTPATTAGWFHGNAGGIVTPQNRCGVKCISPPSGATPGQYACDLNNNGTVNEVAGDGRYLAMNWLSAPDGLAYLDWSGLRPMTELEFEKACRGALLPVPSEIATGASTFTAVTAVTNSGADNELASTPVGANVSAGGLTGPARSGMFATGASTRVQAGSSWYGIMELSGNVWENTVSIGNAAGRAFTGIHGNGALNPAGAADVNFWPGINGNNTLATPNAAYGGVTGVTGYAGIGFCGGTFNGGAWLQVSMREYRNIWTGLGGRDNRNGGRGVRTAP
jgi:formylglycine-generating enzyme required for sulfatase activity